MSLLKTVSKKLIRLSGHEINKIGAHKSSAVLETKDVSTMACGMKRSKRSGIEAATIIDAGAAAGNWTLSALKLWPQAHYVLFEPLEERKAELEELASAYDNFHFIPAATGKEIGTINFFVASDLDGSGVAGDSTDTDRIRSVNVTTIDAEIRNLKLKGPYIIKLDTHGFEVPIIEGCLSIITEVSLFIIECYGFQIAKSSLLFWEMCHYMDTKGFRLVDIVDIMLRPKDQLFWQCDAFFTPKKLAYLEDNSYE